MKTDITKKEDEICKKALIHFGVDSQLDMLIEECAELIQAVNKYKRNGDNYSFTNLIEEIVDVEIVSKQIKMTIDFLQNDVGAGFSFPSIDSIKESKLARLEKIISDDPLRNELVNNED